MKSIYRIEKFKNGYWLILVSGPGSYGGNRIVGEFASKNAAILAKKKKEKQR